MGFAPGRFECPGKPERAQVSPGIRVYPCGSQANSQASSFRTKNRTTPSSKSWAKQHEASFTTPSPQVPRSGQNNTKLVSPTKRQQLDYHPTAVRLLNFTKPGLRELSFLPQPDRRPPLAEDPHEHPFNRQLNSPSVLAEETIRPPPLSDTNSNPVRPAACNPLRPATLQHAAC